MWGITLKDIWFQRHLQFRFLLFVFSSLSITTLLLYFFGIGTFGTLATVLIAIEVIGLVGLAGWAYGGGYAEEKRLLLGGLWGGCLATLAYDVARVPLAHAGVPVFKGISYFGTIFWAVDKPEPLSELMGWAYHFSNGVSFGLMYAAMTPAPGPVTAIVWGLALEGAMLLTPYAEVFGYQRDKGFLAISIGAHVAYGLGLWAGLVSFDRLRVTLRPVTLAVCFVSVPLALSAMAADFYALYANKMPQSPPAYVGPHLYTVWNVPEPDRIVVMWVMQRFVEPRARFHVIEPFDKVKIGIPFDMPEAAIRRHGARSATQFLIDEQRLQSNAKLDSLARMATLTEVTPWMLAADAKAGMLADRVRKAAADHCGKILRSNCLSGLFREIDAWYEGEDT